MSTKTEVLRAFAELHDLPLVELSAVRNGDKIRVDGKTFILQWEKQCPPHLWIRDGSSAVCTHCGVEITEVEKYAPFERHET